MATTLAQASASLGVTPVLAYALLSLLPSGSPHSLFYTWQLKGSSPCFKLSRLMRNPSPDPPCPCPASTLPHHRPVLPSTGLLAMPEYLTQNPTSGPLHILSACLKALSTPCMPGLPSPSFSISLPQQRAHIVALSPCPVVHVHHECQEGRDKSACPGLGLQRGLCSVVGGLIPAS